MFMRKTRSSLLHLDIERCVQEEQSSIVMAGESWKRPALEILLKLYKEHPILYDMRHPKYYNKNERQKTLMRIIDLLEDHRPGTTMNDILKKIQTMRTQFGQELNKFRKTHKTGGEYTPTVWWYNYLSFLRSHIKPRSAMTDDKDYEEDYNSSATHNSDGEYEYTADESYVVDNEGSSEVVYEIQSTEERDTKADFGGETNLLHKHDGAAPTMINGSSKGEIIYEITNTNTIVPKRKIDVIETEELTPKAKVHKQSASEETVLPASATKKPEVYEIVLETDRARSLGQFVTAQIAMIKDDYLFYSTQMEVLSAINKSQLKQLQMDKENN
ncbi:uncharacterized protein LOC129778568 [Toxorhynchites rutilus septentrionalis]|uniref:uncharacterized protein LOC129778568 n=1 Tax=Toxorhynchites rutilus septentrionalis TaxID=329112 RepID=UPI00247AAC15|nr:uncharacterized protein LOC129778568 [Toxorhynchites rutilus septentrionalis]